MLYDNKRRFLLPVMDQMIHQSIDMLENCKIQGQIFASSRKKETAMCGNLEWLGRSMSARRYLMFDSSKSAHLIILEGARKMT